MRLHIRPLSRLCAWTTARWTRATPRSDRESSPARSRSRLVKGGSIAAAVLSLGLLVGTGAAGFASSSARIYVVQPGDSLWAISRADGLTVASSPRPTT